LPPTTRSVDASGRVAARIGGRSVAEWLGWKPGTLTTSTNGHWVVCRRTAPTPPRVRPRARTRHRFTAGRGSTSVTAHNPGGSADASFRVSCQPTPGTANTPYTQLSPRPSPLVRLVKLVPPLVEMLNPPSVAAYTVDPDTNTPNWVSRSAPSWRVSPRWRRRRLHRVHHLRRGLSDAGRHRQRARHKDPPFESVKSRPKSCEGHHTKALGGSVQGRQIEFLR
jgi:hypothetical protein